MIIELKDNRKKNKKFVLKYIYFKYCKYEYKNVTKTF